MKKYALLLLLVLAFNTTAWGCHVGMHYSSSYMSVCHYSNWGLCPTPCPNPNPCPCPDPNPCPNPDPCPCPNPCPNLSWHWSWHWSNCGYMSYYSYSCGGVNYCNAWAQ